jgi:hypothetical protein
MIYSFIYIVSLVHVAAFMSGPRTGNMMRRLSFSQQGLEGLGAQQDLLQQAMQVSVCGTCGIAESLPRPPPPIT